jgi:cytochrome c biogenesis protein
MSVIEETSPHAAINLPVRSKTGESIVTRFLKLISSVRFGVLLLVLLGLACLVGMLVMQQNVDGFENYYAQLTPAQRLVYGQLGFFDIYHVWYFNALLAVLSLNIVLSSFDRFPKTWKRFARPKTDPPLRWIREQKSVAALELEGSRDALVGRIKAALEKTGWRKTTVTEKNGRTYVFGESGRWNRFGAYPVHVGLLTIFLGGFLTAQFGHTGQMALTPGQNSNEIYEMVSDLDQVNQVMKQIPFEIVCTDIQQKLIKKDGSLSAGNTIDWLTKIKIRDGAEEIDATVQMNRPFDYRGYRFFQASFVSVGRAREITVRLNPADGGAPQDVVIPRNGSATLADGTLVKFVDFQGSFSLSRENSDEDSSSYPNPAAVLSVTPAGGMSQTAYAFGQQMAGIPIATKPIGGFTYQLVDFEKVADQHILAVQRDPGANIVYLGFILLTLALVAVFFFSHQRVWTVVEETAGNRFQITAGGNANRSQSAFDEKFHRFINDLRDPIQEASN